MTVDHVTEAIYSKQAQMSTYTTPCSPPNRIQPNPLRLQQILLKCMTKQQKRGRQKTARA